MIETFNQPPQEENPEDRFKRERVEDLRKIFDEAEAVFEASGREAVKPFLNTIYSSLIGLNKLESSINPLERWNEEGDLTEEQFNELNLRRKKLSNAVGIKTASGEIRHDLNEI